jgi:hypothetical protein
VLPGCERNPYPHGVATFQPVTIDAAVAMGLLPEESPKEVIRLAAVVAIVHCKKLPNEVNPAGFRDVFVPNEVLRAMFGLESRFEACVPELPDEDYACADLSPTALTSAYRGAQAENKEPEFMGHRFGDAVDQARESVAAFLRGPNRHPTLIQAFAWPFLWLRYQSEPTDIVLLADFVNRGIRAIRSDELPKD